MDLELKLWNLVALGAIAVIWWLIKRAVDKIEKRFDDQDTKIDLILKKLTTQDKKLMVHALTLKKIDPSFDNTFIVQYDD